jgi:hypothetical protein
LTSYTVLAEDDGNWRVIGEATAKTPQAAIEATLNGNDAGGTFAAVPTRSWKPLTVTPVTSLKFGASK